MGNSSRWVVGGFLVLLSLVGLYITSRADAGGLVYWLGLLVFAACIIAIFNLIRIGFDEAEGKASDRPAIVPIALAVVAIGSVVFHVLSPWWWTPIASNWSYIDTTINLTFWITGIVFVAVVLFTGYCVYRFRHRPGGEPVHYEPENKKLEWWLTIITAVGVAAMLAPGLFVWQQFVAVPEDAAEIEVVGSQWQWAFRMPGEDGQLGTSDVRNISADNPLGLHTDDPAGQDDIIVEFDDLHLPVGQPLKVWLRSVDVLHDFYVPEFRVKMDMVPGMVTHLWLTPTRTGTFEILCAELCGVGHYMMRGRVVVDEEVDYQAWLQGRQTFAQLSGNAIQSGEELPELASRR